MPRRNYKHKPLKHTPFNLGGTSAMATCQTKQVYTSEFEAKQAIARTKQYNPDAELAVYYCPSCRKYHLTGKNPNNRPCYKTAF